VGSGAIFDLDANALRPADWTSADAAGLPIFAVLIRPDEVEAGVIDHAIRVTAELTDRRYVWPARHEAGGVRPQPPSDGSAVPAPAELPLAGYRPEAKVILKAMKRHGMILADNGSNFFFGGAAEDGWTDTVLDELRSIPADAFQAVRSGLMKVDPDSGRSGAATSASKWAEGRLG
jgi:hypothetical protein